MRAESSKEDKIAAAKRKLKEFQSKKDQSANVSEDNADTASINSSIIAIDNDKLDDDYYQKQIANLEDLLKNAEAKIRLLENSNAKLSDDYVNLQSYQTKIHFELNENISKLTDKIETMHEEHNNFIETIKLKDEQYAKIQQQQSEFLKQIQSYQELVQRLENDLKTARDENKLAIETDSLIAPCTNCQALQKDNTNLKSLIENKIKQNDDIQAKTNAMEKLSEKFNKIMQNFANVTEDKQHLEHLVQQLQCETDTIGEYITLYREQKVKLDRKIDFYNQKIEQFYTTKEQLTQLICNIRDFLKAHQYVLGDKIDFNYIENICSKLGQALKNVSDMITSDFSNGSQPFTNSRSGCIDCDRNNQKCSACSGKMFIV